MKSKNKFIGFHGGNEAAVQVYKSVMDYAHAHNLFAWQVIEKALEALEILEQSTIIHYTPDMELSEFVKACTQAALDDISESEKIDLEKIRSGKLTQEDVKRLKPLTAQNETK